MKTIKKTASQRYKSLDLKEHVLLRSETYIGSKITFEKEIYLLEDISDLKNIKFIKKTIPYNTGFLKLFDEIIVNATDHVVRTENEVKNIKIEVTKEYISVYNDGPGIPIEIHDKDKIYIPQMLFGKLISGENFDDDIDKRFTGGRNGYGASLVNVFSTKFEIECADGKKLYKQSFFNNLSTIEKPIITKHKGSYTKVTFYPDFKQFGLTEINDNFYNLILKRTIDAIAYCPNTKFYFNKELINIKNYKDYVKLYNVGDFFYEKINDNWECVISKTTSDNFESHSMVNGIITTDGGSHVNYIINQICDGVAANLQKKHKKIKILSKDIKEHLFLFLNCKIINPEFGSQTKESLSTKLKNIEDVNISDGFIKKISESSIIEEIIAFINAKELAGLQKSVKKFKIKKLDDANFAGTNKSQDCQLYLTEGDSASSSAIAGFSVVGRDYFGCFPLRGKGLNVKKASIQKIKDNEEVKNIISALGLEIGKKYEDTKSLRYGKVVIFSDMDSDGYHIKGLLINLFETMFPELLYLDFIYEFITPLVKAIKGNKIKYFYKINDYIKFKETDESKGYSITYYKGVGSLSPDDTKKLFKNLDKHLIKFNYNTIESTNNIIKLIFDNDREDDRKEWLKTYKPFNIVDKFARKTTYENFFNDEFIEFSMENNIRSIPSIVDGLKPTERKILYTFLSKNIKGEVKVSQFSGSVIEHSAYHHGPAALEETIVSMNQHFLGSNNLNLLSPSNGNFGSRLHGCKKYSAPRYIFTKINPITRDIFLKEDDHILEYLDDDGYKIEPKNYLPIIPTILINGAAGIGTGYATNIPLFNGKDIIKYLINKLEVGEKNIKLKPYYNNFKGEIIFNKQENKYLSRGIIEKINTTTLKITELPVGIWTNDYYDILDDLIEKKIIKDYRKNCTDEDIDIEVYLTRENLTMVMEDKNLYKIFELEKNINLTNMYLFDENGKLKKYNTQYEIIDEFYEIRKKYFQIRKDFLKNEKEFQILKIDNKIRFISLIVSKKLIINNRKKEDIILDLVKFKIDKIDDSYDYLLNLSILTLTEEKINELNKILAEEKLILKSIINKSVEEMWINDLKNLKL
jgi:DNA topoisomerase-2